MSPTVGILWDSLSANTGDRAIGVQLLRWAEKLGLPATAVDPATAASHEAAVMLIGGGELLHPPGHPYYDAFRLPGRHLLNAVGTFGSVAAEHLEDYRLVSVRSEQDRLAIDPVKKGALERDIAVVPCTTVTFSDFARDQAPTPPVAGQIGLHVHAGSFVNESSLTAASAVREILGPRVVLFSFTPYNADFEVGRAWAEVTGYAPPRLLATPDEAYGFISRLDAVVVSSLHAAIFAYQSGVPFLMLGRQEKMKRFTTSRGLESRRIRGVDDLRERHHLLARESVDWEASLADDRRRVAEHLGVLAEHLERALTESGSPPRHHPAVTTHPPVADHLRASHAAMLELHAVNGLRIAEALRVSSAQQQARDHATALRAELDAHRRQQLENASYLSRLLDELEAHRAQQLDVAEYVSRLEAELAGCARQTTEARDHLAHLERRIATQDVREAALCHRIAELETAALEGPGSSPLRRLVAGLWRPLSRLGRRIARRRRAQR